MGRRRSRRARSLVFVLLCSLFASLGTPPKPALAIPSAPEPAPPTISDAAVLGGQLFSTGQPVEVQVLPASAGFTSELWLFEPGPARKLATNRDVGLVVQVGTFPVGVELVFGIKVLNTGDTFKMGPGDRNPDGIPHAVVNFLEAGKAQVGFEDLFGGGDRDYNDNMFEFRGGIVEQPPSGPTANAGPDQTVDEGAVVTLDGTASSDPDSQNLTYSWALGNHTGPPITLSSATAAKPTFQTLDDGMYTFTLTVSDGTNTATDDVTVTVRNKIPVLAAQADPAYAGGVALVTTSFTDLGILDTHTGTLSWGDGSAPQSLPVSAQGTGWGTLVASHVYASAGSYPVTITITDDDNGSATTTVAGLQVIAPVALWANSNATDASMESTSGAVTVTGLTHTNDDLRVRGGAKTFTGPTEYVRTLDVGGAGATFNPPAVKTGIKPYPITFPIADYRPGGRAAIEAGPAWHNMSSSCGSDGFWHVVGSTLTSGIYYASCGVQINGNPIGGTITVAAEGDIKVSGSGAFFDPYIDGLLFVSYSTGTNAIQVDASGSTFFGYSFAERGRVSLTGANNQFYCGILADRIDIAAQSLSVRGSGCTQPARTIAPPTIVPNLAVDLSVDHADSLPAQPLHHTATITNTGSTLVVPGVIGVENLGASPVSVTSHTLGLEYQATDGSWHPIPGDVTISIRPNAYPGVTYPVGAEVVDGTTVQPGALASWGYAAIVRLTSAQVAFLLDPTQVIAVRNVSTFTMTPSNVPVRRLFRFGDDFVDQLHSLGGNATNVSLTIVPPAGDPTTFTPTTTPALSTLTPGEVVSVDVASTVPAPAPRAQDESDAAYLARLATFDGSLLVGAAFGRGTAGIGPILAATDVASTTRHLPVVSIDTTGPASIEAGTTANYALGLANGGSVAASNIVVSDAVTGAGSRPVTGAPATLAAGGTASAAASYPVPPSQTQSIVNTGSVTWKDTAGNAYGAHNDAVTSIVIAPRKLAVVKTDVTTPGANPGTISYEIAVTNLGDQSVSNVVVNDTPDALTSLINGTVSTTAGTVTTGNGTDDTSVSVALGTLAGRTTQVVSFHVSVGFIPEGVASVSNQATVTSTELAAILSDDPGQPGATDPTTTPVGPTAGGGGGGGGGEARPVIEAPSPADGTVVTEPVTITSTITPPEGQSVASWKISATQAGTTGETTLAQGAGAGVDAPLDVSAAFDPTKLPNGTYLVTIRSTASGGGIQTSQTSLVVDGNLKLGRYQTTYQDLSVGVAGLPMQVLRTYDSFDKSVGDFGVGWQVQLANFKVQVNKPLGYGGWVQEIVNCSLIFCQTHYRSTTPHTVTVVWPDGHQEIFDLTPANGSTFFRPLTEARFTGRARTTSTLQADGDVSLSYFDDGNLYGGGFGSGGIYDPQRFRLTAKDGTVYVLDRTSGLVSATDRSGSTLTVSPTGITSSRGPSITFTRDAQGRITKIVGPEDETLLYSYDVAGDLRTFTDPNSRVLSYDYDGAHNLKLTKDPLNRPFQTLTYDGGRLASVTDALGNEVHVATDPQARTETVTDAEGRLITISTFDSRGNVVEAKQLYDGKTAITTFQHDAFDNLTKRIDPNGHAWSATYEENRIRTFTDPTGHTVEVRYDALGYPTLWKQPMGGQTVYDWNDDGTLASVTDALGHAETYTYDAAGNLETRTDRNGKIWHYTYFPTGKLKTSTDPLGHATQYAYDDSGRLVTFTDATNRITSYAYWPDGKLKSTTAPGGLVTSYVYDELGLLKSKTDAAGKTTTWTYDGAGRVRTMTDPAGGVTTYAFDGNGRLETVTAPDTGVTTHVYDGAGHLASVTDPVGRLTSYTYDLAGRLSTTESPAHGVTQFTYDTAGRQLVARDPLGHELTKTYDGDGNVSTETDGLGHLTRYDFNLADQLFRVTDAAGGVTQFGFDGVGRITSVTNPENETTATEFDPAGRVAAIRDGLNHATTYGYDDAGRVLTTTDALSHSETRTYDAAGRVATVSTASGITTTYTYDPRGMVATERNPLGQTTTYTYDNAGRLSTERDPRNFTTTYTYDPVGRLKTIKDPKNAVIAFGYNLAGEQTSLTDPRGKTWQATFDVLGGLKTTTDPLGHSTTRHYDTAGRQDQSTDARGIVSTYVYDAANNLDQITAGGLSITYTQDSLNRRKTMSSAVGTTTWSYDGASRVTSVASPAGTVGYAYDDAGRRTSMTLPTGSVAYGYSDDNRLTSLVAPSGTFGFTYLADGRPQTVTRPNGVTTKDGYDAAGRLTSITHAKGATTLASYTYGLDANGNRTSRTSASGTETYTVNELNQLTRVVLPGGSTTDYGYDAAGNRSSITIGGTATTYAYDDASQLTSVGGTAYTNDAAGNRLSGGGKTYNWDSFGRLASATSGGTTTSYASDGDGRRVSSTTGGVTSTYLWDLARPLDELVSDGTRTYLQENNQLLSEQSASSIVYPLADAIGSIRTVSDATGTAVGTARFDVFGATTAQTGVGSAFGFAGEPADIAGVFLRARTLDPVSGVFLSVDPMRPGAPGVVGYNPYSYGGNNPTTFTDPTGRVAIADYGSLLKYVVLAAAAFLTCYSYCSPAIRGIVGMLSALAAALPLPREAPDVDVPPAPPPDNVIQFPKRPPVPEPEPRPIKDPWPYPPPLPLPNPDRPNPCENQAPGKINYGPLINGTMATGAWATITAAMLGSGTPASVDPPGWKPGAKIDRGHLLGAQLGGTGDDLRNIVALYDNPNRGRMRVFEKNVAAAVARCEIVTYLSIPLYGGGSLPVSSVSVRAVGDRGYSAWDDITNELP